MWQVWLTYTKKPLVSITGPSSKIISTRLPFAYLKIQFGLFLKLFSRINHKAAIRLGLVPGAYEKKGPRKVKNEEKGAYKTKNIDNVDT